MKRLVLFVLVCLVSVVAATAPDAMAQAKCQSVQSGGKLASAIQASNIRCDDARSKLRRWLGRASLPRNQYGWYCARISNGRRLCAGGNGGGAPYFTFKLRQATGSTTAQSAGVRDCHHWASYPTVLISSVRNMTCRRAKRVMRQYRAPINRTFTIPAGFYCYRVSGFSLGGQWRCVKGSRAFRFDFAD
jgi:hypothetical protein